MKPSLLGGLIHYFATEIFTPCQAPKIVVLHCFSVSRLLDAAFLVFCDIAAAKRRGKMRRRCEPRATRHKNDTVIGPLACAESQKARRCTMNMPGSITKGCRYVHHNSPFAKTPEGEKALSTILFLAIQGLGHCSPGRLFAERSPLPRPRTPRGSSRDSVTDSRPAPPGGFFQYPRHHARTRPSSIQIPRARDKYRSRAFVDNTPRTWRHPRS